MSRSQQIRDALAVGGDVHIDAIMAALEAPSDDERKVRALLSTLTTTGELGHGESANTWHLASIPRAGKSKKKLCEIADKAKAEPKGRGSAHLFVLALSQLFAAGEMLRATLREQVDGVDDNELLRSALSLHEGAERLLKEAK